MSDSTAPTVKPGYQTTEFWMTVVATLLTALVASGVIPTGSPVQGYITEALFVLGAAGYHAGRLVAKSPDTTVADEQAAAVKIAAGGGK